MAAAAVVVTIAAVDGKMHGLGMLDGQLYE